MSAFYPFYKICFLSEFIVSFLGTKKEEPSDLLFYQEAPAALSKVVEKKDAVCIHRLVCICDATIASLADNKEIFFGYL